jgi:hypothetical protein
MTNILLGAIALFCVVIAYTCVSVYLLLKQLVGNPWMMRTISQEDRYI